MAYFQRAYPRLRFPVLPADDPGLRPAQLGAAFAIAAHFTRSAEPALVVMPTGSGKTAVAMLAPFLLRCNRVLVVAPGVVLRDQLGADFTTMEQLKEAGVLPKDIIGPLVRCVDREMRSEDDWNGLRLNDVVVGTPHCLSPAFAEIVPPPRDLFDLVIVDEAHHEPATIWNGLLDSLPETRRLLATATPFRSDSRAIRGHVVYNYPVADAFADRVFGSIEFVPVDASEDDDESIALTALETLIADRREHPSHLLLVRTDGKERARQLEQLYVKQLGLRLERVDSSRKRTEIETTVRRLRAGELDGVICVDMLGEGVSIPQLKIAAIHSPHKSLGVTLQFIGRFARAGAPGLGTAKFIAVPGSVAGQLSQLYKEGAVWESIVPALIGERVDREVWNRAELAKFRTTDEVVEELKDLSLLSLQPFSHVKIYRTESPPDLHRVPALSKRERIVYRATIEDGVTSVFITLHRDEPRWMINPLLTTPEYHLYVVYYSEAANLLFINASAATAVAYDRLAGGFCETAPAALSVREVNRVLLSLTNPKFSNVGMRHRLPYSSMVSYQTLSGRRADRIITATHGFGFSRGHVYCRGEAGDGFVSIGFSGGSIVWSNFSATIPEITAWCDELAHWISQDREVITHTGLDYLSMPESITRFPPDILAAVWHTHTIISPIRFSYETASGETRDRDPLSFELVVNRSECTEGSAVVTIQDDLVQVTVRCNVRGNPWIEACDDDHAGLIRVESSDGAVPLIDYLNAYPLALIRSDFSHIMANEWTPILGQAQMSLGDEHFTCVDWPGGGVDIQMECPSSPADGRSIHEYLTRLLLAGGNAVVFYDHTRGEIADFVVFSDDDGCLLVDLYHCKGSGAAAAADRVEDAYEVCGQVAKSVQFMGDVSALVKHFQHRATLAIPRYIRGDEAALQQLLTATATRPARFRITLVQPGLSRSRLKATVPVLAAANDYVMQCGCMRLHILCSH